MKKFLSLVLAMIMTMSLVTISAGATEYKDLTDKDEIQYEEAVAVLNRIGVITGYDDGSFRPEGELTRGAAAKIIVSLLIGPEAANNLPNATAPYPDVPASHTFAGVISYCKTAGIISGYGDGTFKPGNSLTGFAFAKMLLGALGYKSEIEGFVDTGWTMNVAKVGNVVGLFDRLDFDGAASVNREEACQLALNTLKATMVTYGGTTMVTGAQNMFVQGTQAMYVTSNNREINANINRRVISAQNNELTLEFGEEHFKDLRLEHDKYDPAYDDYGHPSNEWSWKKVTIGTFKLPADFTYTNQVAYREDTVAAKEKALGLRGYDTFSTDHRGTNYNWSSPLGGGSYTGVNSPFDDATQITINGYNARANAYGALVSYDASKITNKTDAPTLSEIADLTDNGVTVEVYVCPVDADFITNVVVTRTQLMKVKRIGSDYVTVERISPDSRDPRKDEAEKDSIQGLRDITGYNAFAIDVDTLDVKDNNYDAYNTLKDLKAGDRVAVVPFTADQGKTWEVGEAYVPETVSGKLSDVGLYMNTSKTDGNATSITVGGTKYVINEWNLDMIDVKKAQINATRKDVTAYLAKDGTVLWATEIGNSDDWMIVGDYYQAANSNGKVVWFAHGWTIGGEEVNVDLGTIRKEAEYYAPGELVHYQLAQGGTGEYELGKPNNTGFSSWYSHDGDQIPEDRLTKTVNNKKEYSGEGVYNVAQYVLNNGESKPYSIHPANSLIALEDYTNYLYPATANTAYGGAIYGDEYTVDAEGKVTITANEGAGHKWDYRSTTYNNDGVKFIYVNFDSVTGNVDYISTRKDAQTVENAELAGYNKWWYNTATNVANDQRNWVVSPAEAYVNDDGNVEAVVIKCEPAQADLSNVIIVGEYVGTEYGKTGAETSATNPSNVSAREYWQGPTFSEKKTGYFKNGHNVGDIVVIRSTDANNVMDCKMFNGGNFENRNPDVFTANGIAALKSAMDEKSKVAFYVGKNSGDTVLSQNGKINLVSSKADIMSDIKVEAEDWDNLTELEKAYYEGLIKVSGAKWIDLRANRGSDEVESLGDLLDLDNDTVQIKVLLNAKSSTETFRRAYAIVVLRGYKLNQVDIPSLSIQAVENATYADAKKGDGTAKNPWVFETSVGTDVRLHGVFKNASKLTGKVTSKVWTINDRTVSSDFVSDNDSIWVEAPEVKGEAYGKLVSWTVTVRDDSKVDRRTASATVYAKIVIPADPVVVDDATVTLTGLPEGVTVSVFDEKGNEVKANADGTFTLDKNAKYTVKADGYQDATIETGAEDVQEIKVELTPEKPETVKVNVGTDAITFKNADTDAVVAGLENVTGEVEISTANPLYVEAVEEGKVAVALKGDKQYNLAFVPSEDISFRVIPSTTPQIFGQVLDVNDKLVVGLPYDLSAIPAAASSGDVVENLTTMAKPQPGETPYYKATLADGTVVYLRGVWDGYSWGFTLHDDTPAADSEAFFAALNAGDKVAPGASSEAEFNNAYKDEPDPEKATVTISGNDDAVTVTFTPAEGEAVTGTTTASLDAGTYAVSVPEGYTVDPTEITVVAGGSATVSVTKNAEPDVPETIKATITAGAAKFFAYYGEADEVPALTEAQVKSLLSDALDGMAISVVDLKAGTAKTAAGDTITFGTDGKTAGAYNKPDKLYKVTIASEDYYVETAGKITGLDKSIAGLLPESAVAGAAATTVDGTSKLPVDDSSKLAAVAVANGTANLTGWPAKDGVYIPALATTATQISSLDGAGLTVKVGSETTPSVAISTSAVTYVQKGSKLIFENKNTSTTNTKFTLEINKQKVEGAFDQYGKTRVETTFVEDAKDPGKLNITTATSYDVYLNGTKVTVDTSEAAVLIGTITAGARIAKETTDTDKTSKVLGAPSADVIVESDGRVFYKTNSADADSTNGDGAIHLVTAYYLKPASSAVWVAAAKLNDDGTDLAAATASNGSPLYVRPGDTVWVRAEAAKKTLKLVDGTTGLVLERGSLTVQGDGKQIYTLKVDADVVEAGQLDVDLDASALATTAYRTSGTDGGKFADSSTTPTEIKFDITVTGADSNSEIGFTSWTIAADDDVAAGSIDLKSVEFKAANTFSVTAEYTGSAAVDGSSAAKKLGTLTVELDGMYLKTAVTLSKAA